MSDPRCQRSVYFPHAQLDRYDEAQSMGFEINLSAICQAALDDHLSKLAGLIFESQARRKGVTAEQLLWVGYGVRDSDQAEL